MGSALFLQEETHQPHSHPLLPSTPGSGDSSRTMLTLSYIPACPPGRSPVPSSQACLAAFPSSEVVRSTTSLSRAVS